MESPLAERWDRTARWRKSVDTTSLHRHNRTCKKEALKHMRERRLIQLQCLFAISVSTFLVFSAIAKLVAIAQGKRFLAVPDPVFSDLFPGFTTGASLAIAAILEISVAGFVIRKRKQLCAMVPSSWLVAILVCYRMLAKALYAPNPCHCLGGILDWARIPQPILDAIPVIFLWYMGIGSLWFLLASHIFHNTTDRPHIPSEPSTLC